MRTIIFASVAAAAAFVAQALAADLPTPSISRGEVRAGVTAKDLCPVAHTPNLRNVTEAEKKQVYKNYGLSGNHTGYCAGKEGCEVDHICSLEIGGTNELANLWPQSYDSSPWNAHVKDKLENRLHSEMCKGNLTPQQACDALRTDWTQSYRHYFGDAPK